MVKIKKELLEEQLEKNVNFGIMSPIKEKIRDKKLKKQRIAERALVQLEAFKEEYHL